VSPLTVYILGTVGYMKKDMPGRKGRVLSLTRRNVLRNIYFQPKLFLVLNIVSYSEQIICLFFIIKVLFNNLCLLFLCVDDQH
jgi:hypothetical protein